MVHVDDKVNKKFFQKFDDIQRKQVLIHFALRVWGQLTVQDDKDLHSKGSHHKVDTEIDGVLFYVLENEHLKDKFSFSDLYAFFIKWSYEIGEKIRILDFSNI